MSVVLCCVVLCCVVLCSVVFVCDLSALLDPGLCQHRRRSSVNFRGGGHKIFAGKICIKNQQNARILHDSCPKNYQNTGIFMIFARKIYKIPEFYIIIAKKIFFPEF